MATIIVASIVVGLIVGILSGMLGIGGGTVLVPVFKLGFGMSAISSTATSLFTIIPTSISGVITHIKNKTCLPKLGIAAGIGGAITSPVGVWLASFSPDWAIMVAAALVIIYSSFTSFQKAFQKLKINRSKKQKEEAANFAPQEEYVAKGSEKAVLHEEVLPAADQYGMKSVAVCASIGLIAGVLSGYVGVGGGFIMVPMMMQFLNLPMKMTSGTSLIAVMILATSGTVMQAILGNVDWVAGIFICIGSIPGAYIGSRLMKRIPEVALRFIFAGFLLVAAVLLVFDQLT